MNADNDNATTEVLGELLTKFDGTTTRAAGWELCLSADGDLLISRYDEPPEAGGDVETIASIPATHL